MSNYTIKSGDNLWNIIKSQLKLNNNTEIANKVKEVAKANGISNPNLIFAGKKIELGGAMDTLEKTTPAETPVPTTETKTNNPTAVTNPVTQPVENTKTYSAEITKAVDDKVKSMDIKTYDDLLKLSDSKVSIFSGATQTDAQKKQAYEDYSEKLLLQHYDLNKDGKVTEEEFAKIEEEDSSKVLTIQSIKIDERAKSLATENPDLMELYDKDKDGKISEKEYTEGLKTLDSQRTFNPELIKTLAERKGNLFAKNLDMNSDGIISKEEFAFFNKIADSLDRQEDGVISDAAESGMFQSVTGMNAENKEINRVVNKYLGGQTLTADEQKTLDESTVKIRKALGKAAGLNKAE